MTGLPLFESVWTSHEKQFDDEIHLWLICRGGLEPDKACHDYPHGAEVVDECIKEAVEISVKQETPEQAPSPGPMPYRWLPLTERRFWATGSY